MFPILQDAYTHTRNTRAHVNTHVTHAHTQIRTHFCAHTRTYTRDTRTHARIDTHTLLRADEGLEKRADGKVDVVLGYKNEYYFFRPK